MIEGIDAEGSSFSILVNLFPFQDTPARDIFRLKFLPIVFLVNARHYFKLKFLEKEKKIKRSIELCP